MEKSEISEKNRTNEISVHFSFRGSPKNEISAEKTEIFVHGCTRLISLPLSFQERRRKENTATVGDHSLFLPPYNL